ncbi:hypothetical protein D915_004732 [Fasciola hepatica]|uniref:Uncharacterized protein n=1 Tax=Fasciola hepatica TaxID=6192 RepID=A0A4E0RAN8_FASHE|nr:hypothetical protein D915_004732 [Fasciola hepatica]
MQTEGTSRNLTVTPMQALNPVISQSVTHSDTDMLQPPPISSLHNPPDVSITGYQSIARPGSESLLPATYPYPNPDQFQPMYNAHDRVRQPYTWSNQRYSIDLNSGSIQEQLDTQNQWWPASDQSRSRKSYRLDSG